MLQVIKKISFEKVYPYILVVGGIIGFLAASILTIEKIELIVNATYAPTCNINPILSCGSVMKTAQASVFGFPNSLLGIAGFAVVITVGMALLAGAKFKRWFWHGLELGTLLGVLFVHWLFYQSVYVIGALCPYCMVVWTVTIPIFIYTTFYNLQTKVLPTPKFLKSIVASLQKHRFSVLMVWYGILFVLILNHFWYYWKTLIQ